MDDSFQQSTIEALILASPEPLPARKIADMIDGLSPSKVSQAVAGLNTRYMQGGTSFRIREIAGGYQVYIVPEYTGYVQEMFSRRRKMRLTRAALETLAIITYKQPVTRVEIEQIRGVASDGVIHNLLEKNMITIKGRSETVGKPLQYGTTDEFLKFFGLNNLEDLPRMSEIEELLSMKNEDCDADLEIEEDEGNGNGNGNGNGEHPVTLNLSDEALNPGSRVEIEDADEEADLSSEQQPEQGEPEEASSEDKIGDSGIIIDIDTT